MRQFSIKNERAATLLEQVTRLTGEGKDPKRLSTRSRFTKPNCWESVRRKRSSAQSARAFTLTSYLEYRGKVPSKTKLEDELGMP